jgi:hypothetical protein
VRRLVERLEKLEEASPAARALQIRAVNNLVARVAASPDEADQVLAALRDDKETCKVIRSFPRDEDDVTAARRDEGIQVTPLALAVELRVSVRCLVVGWFFGCLFGVFFLSQSDHHSIYPFTTHRSPSPLVAQALVDFFLELDPSGGVDMLTRTCPNGFTALDYTFAEGGDPDIRLNVLQALREGASAGLSAAKRAKVDHE